MSDLTCIRCGKTTPRLPSPPMPTDLGARVYDTICPSCWKDWLRQQTSIINHYGLDLRNPEAKAMLTKETEKFLFEAPKTGA